MFIFGINIDSEEILADRKNAGPSTTLGSFGMPDLLHSLNAQEILVRSESFRSYLVSTTTVVFLFLADYDIGSYDLTTPAS
jgi:hypothetical protein